MSWPLVWRSTFERLEDKLDASEIRYKELDASYKELKLRADKLVDSIINVEKTKEEDPQSDIGFAPKISDVRNAANSWARKRSQPS